MRNPPKDVPALYVEGADDISAIAALLRRHGYDTKRGKKHLFIAHAGDDAGESTGSDGELFDVMPDVIKSNPAQPCGFVFDIDIEVAKRWERAKGRLQTIVSNLIEFSHPLPDRCTSSSKPGYIGQVKGYAKSFGVWLMPDCQTDDQKLEHLVESLIPANDAILLYAKQCTAAFPKLVSDANATITDAQRKVKCFAEKDRIKAEIRTWLAWQEEPGQPFGAAITRRYLGNDSPQALAFLDWLSRLYGFSFPGPDPIP
jgi:hypothetical protein